MTPFKYVAINGEGSTVEGQIEAEDDRHAQRLLRRRGLSPLSVRSTSAAGATKTRRKRVSSVQSRILMLRELAVLLEAGVPLSEAIASLAQSREERDLQQGLDGVSRDIRQGQNLHTALRAHLSMLPTYVFQLVEAGELTGQLKSSLKDGVEQMEYEARVAGEIRGALTYPLFLLGSGCAAVIFIFIVVVPRFADMFKGRADSLPPISRLVMGTGLYVRDNLFVLALVAAAFVLVLNNLVRQSWFRERARRSLMNVPVVGPWLAESDIAQWTTMLSTLLTNRIPLLNALELARLALNSPDLQTRLALVERAVRGGTALSSALEEFCGFPTAVLNLIRAGERAGNLPHMLRLAARMSEESVRLKLKQTIALIEPASVIIVGGLVGLIVISIILAITSLNQIQL